MRLNIEGKIKNSFYNMRAAKRIQLHLKKILLLKFKVLQVYVGTMKYGIKTVNNLPLKINVFFFYC